MTYTDDKDREFFNDATWAIIGHEKLANEDLEQSMISDRTIKEIPDLKERIAYYKNAAR